MEGSKPEVGEGRPLKRCAGNVVGIAFVYYCPGPGFTGEDFATFRTSCAVTMVGTKVVK